MIDGLRKVDGDTAKYALDNKLVDELATSTEVEKALTKQFGWSKEDNNYSAISYYDYNVKTPSDQGSAIAVIFANGASWTAKRPRATSAAIPPPRRFAMRASIRK
jgi:protease-4